MLLTLRRRARRLLRLGLLLLPTAAMNVPLLLAQASYSVRFEMEKPSYVLGEPIFCRFVIRNTGHATFAFRYRTPTRNLGVDYEQEPRFTVQNAQGQALPDPGPRPCGSPQGTAVYGSVTLPAGQVHSELWLLNQWAQFSTPGVYHVHAERRLALLSPGPQPGSIVVGNPMAFALAIDELTVRVDPGTPAQLQQAYAPYLAAVKDSKNPSPAEAVVVLTSLPQPFFMDELTAMANAADSHRWDRRDALNGLARLNTPEAWKAILDLFTRPDPPPTAGAKASDQQPENPLRAYALLLLAEKGDSGFLPALMSTLAKSAEPLRGDILRSLGFFHDPRAYQLLFDNLHSPQVTDRMNAILGLKNLGGKDVIPALLASLNDPEAQVRQVASFALEGLTGHHVAVSADPTREESAHVASEWHAWWREHAGTFSPALPTPCHDW